MKRLTDRQQQRRNDILAAARRLISERGYDGVKMRELADASGVTPKTLYHQFDSKENLLRHAVEERFRDIYRDIDDADIDSGIERLYFIVEGVVGSIRENEAYARSLAPVLASPARSSSLAPIRTAVYRRALEQMDEAGDLTGAVGIDALNAAVLRHVSALFQAWRHGDIADLGTLGATLELELSLLLAGVTRGATHERVMQTIRLRTAGGSTRPATPTAAAVRT